MRPCDGYTEDKDTLSLLRLQKFPVHIQGNRITVGINSYLRNFLQPVNIAASTQMDKGLRFVPCSFVQVERVFFCLAVEGYDALLIQAMGTALVSSVCREVEGIPQMGCPHPGMPVNTLQNIFVILTLELLRVISLLRMRGLESDVGVRAIFAEAHNTLGIFCVIVIEEAVILFQIPKIPTKIEVVAANIRDPDQRTVMLQHKGMGHSCGSCFVHCVTQVIEQHMVFHQVFGHAMNRHLIAQAPAYNGGMVIALGNELPHLVQRILPTVGHMLGDVGNLRPDHHAVFVTEIIEFLGMLIVGKTNGVGTHFPNNVHILPMFPNGNGIAQPLPILMAADTPQRIGASVELKAPLRVKFNASTAESGGNAIHLHAAAVEPSSGCIEKRIVQAIPQVYLIQGKKGFCMIICDFLFLRLLIYGNYHSIAALLPSLNQNVSGFFHKIHTGCYSNTRSSVLFQFKMSSTGCDEVYIPV